jgi:RHS repeat-associated protein
LRLPYFNIDYEFFETLVDPTLIADLHLFKGELMDEILDNYKDNPSSYNIWQLAVKIIACGTDYAGTCDFVAADANPASTFFTGLTTAQKDQIWNTYKQLYLSEKAKVNQIFVDAYAIRAGIYNGYIGEESGSMPNLSAFLYYPTFLLPVATEVKIMSLYSDAIAAVDDGDTPWLSPEDVSEFGEKVKRFEPIYGSFDGGLPEDVMAAEMEEEVDAKLYIETGKCPLHLDAERLLNGLAMEGLLADGTAINWDDFGPLSMQLYEAMGGQTGLSDVFITAEEVGSTLVVQVENAATGDFTIPLAGTMETITLNSPTEGDWADVVGVEMLYYIPESGLDGTYNFEILLQMQVPVGAETVYVEEVITGFTSLVIGDCYEPEVLEMVDCDRTQDFATNLATIFNHFYDIDGGVLAETLTPVNALDELGGWYAGSEVRIQLLDDASAATMTSDGGTIAINFSGRTIYMEIGTAPTDIAFVMGATYDESATFSELTIYYVDTDGEIQTMTADINDFCSADCNFLDFTCPTEICVPLTLAPKSCTEQWENYHAVIDVLNSDLEEELDYEEEAFSTYTKDQFCDTRLAYSVEAYLNYISADGFTIDSPEDAYFLTLAEFAATQLNAYYDYNEVEEVYEAISSYKWYATEEPANPYLSWGDYVNSVYLVDSVSICPPDPLPYYPNFEFEYPCELYTANVDTVNANNQLEIYLEKLAQNFRERYLEAAISSVVETFTATFNDKEYHYTLYYYDQAGNLIQTVPPKGVDRFEAVLDQDKIELARNTPDYYALNPADQVEIRPVHDYNTQYHYNSLNQLVWQSTPDGGESYFGYDKLGRLVVSQNAKQEAYDLTEGHEQFSYTRYDGLGRIVEVGEMTVEDDVYGFNENGRLITLVDGELVEVSAENFPINLGANLIAQEEVTRTQYDELFGIESTKFADYSADNTRNRITGVYYFETFTGDLAEYDNATFYDYDVHGNVKEMLQDIKDEHLEELEQNIKKVNYEYDLVSGNVKHVTYQKAQADQFIHEYEYDSDNRITNVRTSKDDVIWEQDAKYFYYNHGPLARTEIGDKKVQATDYAYTIQGWLKGVNSENLTITDDQGKDAKTGINRMNAKDAFGYSLHYYNGDYSARFGNDFLSYSDAAPTPVNLSLYNGNIREMYTASTTTAEAYLGTSHTLYQYDQLNRIKAMQQEELSGAATPTHTALGGFYASNYSYDENGNLMTLNRWAKHGGVKTHIDSFAYNYAADKNQLTSVDDALGASIITGNVDLASQSAYEGFDADYDGLHNYHYDEIGQLIEDRQEQITDIQWTVTGKVHKIIREASSTKEDLEFVYDAMGNRIIKIIYDSDGGLVEKTYYIRDAQGNVMSIYTLKDNLGETYKELALTERDLYGSSRLGTESPNFVIASYDPEFELAPISYTQTIGDKNYELSNHLGNVLQVVTDRKLAVDDGEYDLETYTYTSVTPDGIIDYFTADVVSQSDYYPFGMMLPGRNSSEDEYRYGFQGQEMDDEIKGEGNSVNYKYRMHDPRVGRFFAVDPLAASYPWNSPYVFSENNVIRFAELEGLEIYDPVTNQTGPFISDQGSTLIQKIGPNEFLAPPVTVDGPLPDHNVYYEQARQIIHTSHPWVMVEGIGFSGWTEVEVTIGVKNMENKLVYSPGSGGENTVVSSGGGQFGMELEYDPTLTVWVKAKTAQMPNGDPWFSGFVEVLQDGEVISKTYLTKSSDPVLFNVGPHDKVAEVGGATVSLPATGDNVTIRVSVATFWSASKSSGNSVYVNEQETEIGQKFTVLPTKIGKAPSKDGK